MPKGSNQIATGSFDLFGESITRDALLRDKFIEPPFSILDTTGANWIKRRKMWQALGIQSEVGRGKNLNFSADISADKDMYRNAKKLKGKAVAECLPTSIGESYGRKEGNGTSIFDPALCEVLYHWFCDPGGRILDPFAGGSVRGIVANKLGFKYTGIDIRPEQIESNYVQGNDICNGFCPEWFCGDSNIILDSEDIKGVFDMIMSCPPYADLEVYSDIPGDISNMLYDDFLHFYSSIIKKSCDKLKSGGYAAWVIGEVRDKKGYYHGFVPDTIRLFREAGLHFYNDAILRNAIGTATIRANNSMVNKKLVKIHQNVLVFIKP